MARLPDDPSCSPEDTGFSADNRLADRVEPSPEIPPYRPEYTSIAREMRSLGATDENLARALRVSEEALTRWRTEHEDFAEAYAVGRKTEAERIENAMLQRAIGCDEIELKVVLSKNGPVVLESRKHLSPDPGAARCWLQRAGEKTAKAESPFQLAYRELCGTAIRPKDPQRRKHPE